MSIDLSKVFDLSRNVFIEACAGAGKTWLLSKRYAAIMDDFARQHADNPQAPLKDAANILVITFTRKAAAEMSGRIYSDLDQLLNDQTIPFTPGGFGAHLRTATDAYKLHLRATYSRNAISTIDSFCTQILREQAEKMDIDPEFRIQDEADTQRMILETWERFLREKSREQDPDLKVLLEHLSIHHLNEYVKKLQGNAQLLQEWLEHQSQNSPQKLVEEFKQAHPLPDIARTVEMQLLELVTGLPDPSQMLDAGHPQYQTLVALAEYLHGQHADPYDHTLELVDFLRRLTLTGAGDKYLAGIRMPGNVWTPDWTRQIRERLSAVLSLTQELFNFEELATGLPTRWDLIACTVQHHLARFYLAYEEAVNTRLKRENILSFDEIIVRTHALLQNPGIAAQYGQRFSHILFDEFQDTNDLRWDIVRLIAQGDQTELRRSGLFLVGDTKQSIYRFNQADVQVMNRTRALLEQHGAWVLTADETYRSSRAYVETVINPLITATFPTAEEQAQLELYETHFQTTTVAPESPLSEAQHGLARCTIHAVVDDAVSRGTAVDVIKTADISREWSNWIKQHLSPNGKGPRIGILLRTFTHILDYIRIFTQMGLEFEVLASKGLFAQQESFDIYHLLSVLVNPLDDQSLIGLLRSPFFVLSDPEIQKLKDAAKPHQQTGWVWESLSTVRPEIQETLAGWHELAAREPLDRLITRILAEGDRQLGWISETGGQLRLENIRKLIHNIHSLSLDGLGVREVFEYFKYQIQHGDAGQAELPGSAEIQILSIHKSKGLEFPVVILPGLHSFPRAETSGMYLGCVDEDWQVGLTIDTLSESHKTWRYETIKEHSKAEEEAEDKRLFYVALTRAQFGVSFVTKLSASRIPPATSWWQRYVQPVYDLPQDKDQLLNAVPELAATWRDRNTETLTCELVSGSEVLSGMNQESHQREISLLAPPWLDGAPSYEEISPHTIMTWMDPRSAAGAEERQKGEDLGLETSALTFGRLLHRVMEMEWHDTVRYRGQIDQFLLNEGVVDPDLQSAFLTDLEACLSIYRHSSLAVELAQLPASRKLPELPVFGYLKNDQHVYKVSGIIDLLYRQGDDWIVLDYKTDKELPADPQQKEYSYWYQIQTYLWILKRLYQIEARGVLYFNRFDQQIEIAYEEDLYFSRLARLEQARELVPFLPSTTAPDPRLAEIIQRLGSHKRTLVIEPTRDSCERLAQYLSINHLHLPDLQILTINELRKRLELEGRRLTPYLTRLGVAGLLGKRPQWGVVNRLADAFYKATQGEIVLPEKAELYTEFLNWCGTHGITAGTQTSDLKRLDADVQIILDSVHATAAADYQFLQALSRNHDLIFLDPRRQGQATPGFDMVISDWSRKVVTPAASDVHNYTVCFSVQEEVQLIAHQIHELLDRGVQTAEIQVAVSSMERYVPSIMRIFDEQALPVRLSKREPVMERPVTQLAFGLIQGRLSYRLSWDMAMAVWLHPLVTRTTRERRQRQLLDIEVRKLGITQLDDSLPAKLTKTWSNTYGEHLAQQAEALLQFCREAWRQGNDTGLAEGADWLLGLLRGFEFTLQLEPGSVASKAYTSLKNALEGVKGDWHAYLRRKGSLADLNRELRERLKGVEVSSTQQGFGVDVVSFLDTSNQHAPYLFILGMTEGQFPMTPDNNPFLKQTQLNPWFLNLYLFNTWLAYPRGKLFITAPERDAGGESLEISTFCQYLKREDYPALPMISLSQQVRNAAGKRIKDPSSVYQMRHNELLLQPGEGRWFGKLDPHLEAPVRHISATAFDDLLKCPQRYWYGRVLGLEPAETDIAAREDLEIGNLVHQVLERFGQTGGFALAAHDMPAALVLLEGSATQLFRELEVDPGAELLNSKRSELYFAHFEDPQRNLLTALLAAEQPVLPNFSQQSLYEQAFGREDDPASWPAFQLQNEGITLFLRGQIDRVLLNHNEVWATDYKTGQIELNLTREFWTSQMLFYYLVLKTRFPDKAVMLTYEQIRSFKASAVGFKGFIGDADTEHPVLQTRPARGNLTVAIADGAEWSTQRIKADTLAYAQPLALNIFPLTQRDEQKACAYCPFDRICRKAALPR